MKKILSGLLVVLLLCTLTSVSVFAAGGRRGGGGGGRNGVCASQCVNNCTCPSCGATMVQGACPNDGTLCDNTQNCPSGGTRPMNGSGAQHRGGR